MEAPQRLVDHFFRREYGRLVALLTRTLGFKNLDLVEDVVQSALAQALQSWSLRGIPEDPAGWLYRVAKNAAIDSLRRDRRWVAVREQIATAGGTDLPVEIRFDDEFADDQLRMLFVCCNSELPPESQVAMALKTLCGFGVREIASALLTSDRKSTRLNSSHLRLSRMPSSA